MSLTPHAQDCNLFVSDAGRFREPVDDQIGKVLAQNPRADPQLWLGNDKHQKTSGREPAIGMLQKDQFQPLVACLARLKVVRWVEVQQRERFRRAAHIEGACLQRFDSQASCLLGSICVNFNSVATGVRSRK